MLSKEKMFKITSVVMESGCTKYLVYRNLGWTHAILNGTRYVQVGKHDKLSEAAEQVNKLHEIETNSCMKSKEKHIWPN